MTFTYSPSATPTELTLIRFHINDVVSASAKFSDEEIDMINGQEDSWQEAVITLLTSLIMRMAVPDFKADWLQVSLTEARKTIMQLLIQKRREFGIPAITGTIKHRYRPDSRAYEAPDFADMQDTSSAEDGR